MNAQEIRELYPNPKAIELTGYEDQECPPDGYCVGGALGFMLGFEDGFPTTDEVATYLEMTNGELTEGEATDLAHEITEYNDTEAFEEAWETLDRALAWGDPLA